MVSITSFLGMFLLIAGIHGHTSCRPRLCQYNDTCIRGHSCHVNWCHPCPGFHESTRTDDPIEPSDVSENMLRIFATSLRRAEMLLKRWTVRFENAIQWGYRGDALTAYRNFPPQNPFTSQNSQEESLSVAYNLLVGMAANLTTSGRLEATLHDVRPESVLREPVCYLWLAMRSRGIHPTNQICRQSSCCPMESFEDSPTRSQAFAYVSMHRSVHLLKYIRHYLRREFD